MLNSRFWEDNYISELSPIEKLIFIYFISNPRISLSGIYEVPLKNIILDTGVEKTTLENTLDRFRNDGKIAYLEGWLCVINYPKYQNYASPTIKIAISNEIRLIPTEILDKFIHIGYPIDTLSIPPKGKGREQGKGKVIINGGNFEKFWSEYPKKVSKKKAEQVFIKINPNLEAVLSGLARWKQTDQWKKDSGQFIPYPATWLYQERWKDDVPKGKSTNLLTPQIGKYDKYQ